MKKERLLESLLLISILVIGIGYLSYSVINSKFYGPRMQSSDFGNQDKSIPVGGETLCDEYYEDYGNGWCCKVWPQFYNSANCYKKHDTGPFPPGVPPGDYASENCLNSNGWNIPGF